MNHTGNTLLITGGGTGIGRALAQASHQAGNQIIIAGRRQEVLDQTVAAHPGMKSVLLDIASAGSIRSVAARLITDFPALNVVIHNAGIMQPEEIQTGNLDSAEATIATNLLGPIRLTAALLPHLLAQPSAAIMTVSSGLAFVPMALTPTYSATKAAIHSYTQSLRHQLRGTAVEVFELVPPYVQTELMGAQQASDPHAMPLQEFIDETMSLLGQLPHGGEVLVERVKPLRLAEATGKYEFMYGQINRE